MIVNEFMSSEAAGFIAYSLGQGWATDSVFDIFA